MYEQKKQSRQSILTAFKCAPILNLCLSTCHIHDCHEDQMNYWLVSTLQFLESFFSLSFYPDVINRQHINVVVITFKTDSVTRSRSWSVALTNKSISNLRLCRIVRPQGHERGIKKSSASLMSGQVCSTVALACDSHAVASVNYVPLAEQPSYRLFRRRWCRP